MATNFTPSSTVDMSNEKGWPADLGMLDWDNTNIIFTKRTLIEFLRYTGITVDTNFTNISKLPRYATFGTFSPSLADSKDETAQTTPASATASSPDAGTFVPSRRVRTVPGGPHTDIFGSDFQESESALSVAPPKSVSSLPSPPEKKAEVTPEESSGLQFSSGVIPSRRVREAPGGKDSLSNFWDTDGPQEQFVPTRRVRQGPGGQDSISGIF